MPVFKIVAPDGKKYRVDAPEGATEQEALAKVQAQHTALTGTTKAQPMPEGSESGGGFGDTLRNVGAGALRGAGSIGATLARVWPNALGGDTAPENEERRARLDENARKLLGADTDSLAYKGGKLGGEIAGTAGMGGMIAKPLFMLAPELGAVAPAANRLAEAVGSYGFSTGAPAATNALATAMNLGTRAAGGAIAGGASAGLVDPAQAGTGAAIGGAFPVAASALGNGAQYVGRSLSSVVQPYTEAGRNKLAGNILSRFAEGGPTTMNDAELISGSIPTLAEATGNAGISRLQAAARDINPNAFSARETANAAARNAAFDDLAGDAGKLAYFKADRAQAAGELYGKAAQADTTQTLTPYVKGQITQLLKRPSIDEASRAAQKLAMERGELPNPAGSLPALHDVKTIIDDKISEAVRAGLGGQAKALQATKDKLVDVIEKLSPAYKEARITYAEMSKPVNQMEALQGLRLTDSKGNMTLAKVQNALDGIEARMSGPGTDAAKSLTADQVGVLRSLRDDLLRQSNLAAGKSAGSNTFQNIATDNILASMLPGKLGGMVTGKVGDIVGQAGKLAYSGANEKIRNRLVDLMLDPQAAQAAMLPGPAGNQALSNALARAHSGAAPLVYRGAPLLSDQ